MAFEIGTLDLTMEDPDTGMFLTGNVYYVDGVTDANGLRPLSIGQLVMAICLSRAAEMEAAIVGLMNTMNTTSEQLAAMTEIEQTLVDYYSDGSAENVYRLANHTISSDSANGTYAGQTFETFLRSMDVIGSNISYVYRENTQSAVDILYSDLVTKLESAMDSKNSMNQKDMITLQSNTNKRDQAYDMISNILKSLNNTIMGNIGNF